MRAKTARRLALLGVVVVVGAGGAFGLVVVRKWRIEQRFERYRTEGMAAHERGDYLDALTPLNRYVNREEHAEDTEALRALAESRLKVVEANGNHIAGALSVYNRYLRLAPDDREVQETMLGLEVAAQRFVEAADRGSSLLEGREWTADDASILDSYTTALLELRRFDDLREACDRWREIAPQSITPLLRMIAGFEAQGNATARRDYIDAQLAEAPDSAAVQLAAAVEARIALEEVSGDRFMEQLKRAWMSICQATGLEGPDPDPAADFQTPSPAIADPSRVPEDSGMLRVAVQTLDTLGGAPHALVLLEAAAGSSAPDIRALLMRRTWQRGRHGDVAKAGAAMHASEDAPSDALGILGLSLDALGRAEEVPPIIETLSGRTEYAAEAWAMALEAALDESLSTDARIEAHRLATEEDPYEPILRLRYAASLFDQARYAEARQQAEQITDGASYPLTLGGWVSPRLLQAECLLREGNAQAALDLIERWLVPTTDASVVAVLMDAAATLRKQGRRIASPVNPPSQAIERGLELASSGDDAAVRLGGKLVLSGLWLVDEAEREAALDQVASSAVALEDDVYAELAQMRATWGLDPDARLSDRAGGSLTDTMRRARDLAAEGKLAEALQLIEESGEDALTVQLAQAGLVEEHGDEGAARQRWIELTEANQDSLQVQRRALAAPSVAADVEFVEATAQRVRAMTGNPVADEPVVAIALARAALRAAEGRPEGVRDQETERALRAFGEVAARYDDNLPLQLECAGYALEFAGWPAVDANVERLRLALPALERASDLAPQRYALQTAAVRARTGDASGAAGLLARIARDVDAPRAVQLQAVLTLAAPPPAGLSRLDEAISILEAERSQGRADVASVFLLGDLYYRAGRIGDARSQFAQVARLPDAQQTPQTLVRTASFYSSVGEQALAEQTMTRLDAIDAAPEAVAEARVAWAGEFGSIEQVNEAFGAWTALDPSAPTRWTGWMQALAQRGAEDEVQRIVAAAPPEIGARLQSLSTSMLAGDLSSGFLSSLREIAGEDDRDALEAASALLERGSQDPAAWERFAANFPRSPIAQRLAVQQLAAMGAFDAAIALGQVQMQSPLLPQRADLPRMVAELLALRGRPQELLEAAQLWRQREGAEPFLADLAIAEARSQLAQPAQVITALDASIGQADVSTVPGAAAVELYARALIETRRVREALDLVIPLVPRGSPSFRAAVALPLAEAISDPRQAGRLINAVAAHVGAQDLMAPDVVEERVAVALAIGQLAERSAESGPLLERAIGVMEGVLSDDRITDAQRVRALRTLGELELDREEPARALAAFEKALPIAGDEAEAVEALIARVRADVDKFRQLAQAADASPDVLLAAASWFESNGFYADAFAAYDRLLAVEGLPAESAAAIGNNFVMAGVAIPVAEARTLQRLEQIARANFANDGLPDQIASETPSTLAWILVRTGKLEEATALFQAQLDAGKSRPSTLVGLALAVQATDAPRAADLANQARQTAGDDLASWLQRELSALPGT